MDKSTYRDICDRKAVARTDFSLRSSHHFVGNFKIQRCEYIALFTINIMEQCNTSRPVWIVFNCRHTCQDFALITLEIYQTNLSLVASAAVANSHSAIHIPAALVSFWNDQRALWFILCDFLKCVPGHTAQAGSYRFIFFYWH